MPIVSMALEFLDADASRLLRKSAQVYDFSNLDFFQKVNAILSEFLWYWAFFDVRFYTFSVKTETLFSYIFIIILSFKVILQSGMDKQKKSADFRFHGSKFGPVFILKVVHSLAFDIMYFNKSSFIFPMN